MPELEVKSLHSALTSIVDLCVLATGRIQSLTRPKLGAASFWN